MPTYAPGTLVRARGREWVVLPESADDFLVLRPLAGGDTDRAGVLPALEAVESATFPTPGPDDLGDARSAALLRDALRIGFRSTGGPFRSLASLAVDPRPYQYVPLLMALRQETTRLLIADDVGIGKTIEAGLVAGELLAQGEAKGLAVLCPPALAEQWRDELREKFALEAELVLASTVGRLQRGLTHDESIFDRYPVTVVSTDYIKSDRRRDEFLRTAPDLVVVDEAHTCVVDDAGAGGRGRTQRYRLLQDLAEDENRHLVLVTATPHSGNEGAFRNLVGLLDPALRDVDLGAEEARQRLAAHLVQRRRADIRTYLHEDTKFPSDRQTREVPYRLSPSFRTFFDDAVAYARGQVRDRSGTTLQQRVRWWSVLSLLRSIASSPAAAAATLVARSAAAAAESGEAADAVGRALVFDQVEDDSTDADDTAPGAIPTLGDNSSPEARILRDLAVQAQGLRVDDDAKLAALVTQVRGLLREGVSPIVFCRFIPTAHYLAEHIRSVMRNVPVEVVTGELAPDDRSARVHGLLDQPADSGRVLVATDCLSEGVNLQDGFQAVIHYDLAWNPTRHEQREGRVDRFGQTADIVRAVTIYGEDNGIDGIVLNALLRKHAQIRKDLGISVPVPNDTNDRVLQALLEGVLLRGGSGEQLELELFPVVKQLDDAWTSAAETERLSRTRYAQATIRPDEVAREVDAARSRLGRPEDVARFVRTALAEVDGAIRDDPSGLVLEAHSIPVGLRDALHLNGSDGTLLWARDLPAPRGAAVTVRTDERVGALARFILDGALDKRLEERLRPARRAGVMTTNAVDALTVLLLARFRVHVTLPGRHGTRTEVAEEARTLAFRGSPTRPVWLEPDELDALLTAQPSANTPPDRARSLIEGVLRALPQLTPALDAEAQRAADELRDAHTRVRQAARGRDVAGGLGIRGLDVSPQLPVDLLGVYVYLPGGAA
ncbi:MAG: helicase [Cellulomonas sp. 73-92]|uniref:helicase-related protein n=1 Tax=Cellulomonas sp. 73-92 TaxID=1895740 RepID=UPI00092BB0D0|nr:helicase-related protein [Cellulomonas sp. 73-92]OJV83566.1 MAG: helicase [Cellulomonas sp. 73-92]